MKLSFVFFFFFVLFFSFSNGKSCQPKKNPVLPDLNQVKADIIQVMLTSQSFWPADVYNGQPNYGPFFLRQAWHCAGSYRRTDGRGGCDGGRQRFNPELSWDDNTNLDKAKTLLWPIKQKYGAGLSWGDLIILTGTTAIEYMGGPVMGFCAGRIDDDNGDESLLLGPTHDQRVESPCPVNGNCTVPFGTTTIGLIYVNPAGPMGVPDPHGSAPEVRSTFSLMAMNDTETVALIGGGHAFGKTHGACPLGAGPSPKEDPANPWPGLCPNGVYTSGFEGPWTPTPTKWSNTYFKLLLNNNFTVGIGPGGNPQWSANGNFNGNGLMMLTSDISLSVDPVYRQIATEFQNNPTQFANAFSYAWYKLVTRDMGPASRCLGPFVPPPQPFQYPLPPAPSSFPDWSAVQAQLMDAIFPPNASSSSLPPDLLPNGRYYNGAIFVQLAFQCASTFRQTDYLGGCNGARIRFPPEADWPENAGMQQALLLLQPIQKQFGPNLSWSDLIVLAAQVALQGASPSLELAFCPGRTDAPNGDGAEWLSPPLSGSATNDQVHQRLQISGFSKREYVALSARLRSPNVQAATGYLQGSWTTNPSVLSNQYFLTLLNSDWNQVTGPSGNVQYATSSSPSLYMLPTDLNLRWQPDYKAVAQEFAESNDLFLSEFAAAWTKLMNIDRFDGPVENICDNPSNLVHLSPMKY